MSSLKPVGLVVACSFLLLAAPSEAQTFWSQYGKDSQHSGLSTNGVQDLKSILWQAPIDLYPIGSGNGSVVFGHYGCPLITTTGSVVVNTRLGTVSGPTASFSSATGFATVNPSNTFPSANDVYRVSGYSLATGTTLWTEFTDFVDWMPHDWTPEFASCMDSNGKVYSPGAGGTVWVYSNADNASGTSTRIGFYPLSTYNSNPTAFNSNVQICTPITVDANNNIYFGFYVPSGWPNATLNLKSGIAKISSTGVGSWISADAASGDTGDEVATNSAPAVTADGKYLYVAVKQQGYGAYGNPKLLRLNTSNLSTASSVALTSPTSTTGGASYPYIMDDGTSSPMIGPDGDVFFGVWYGNVERGFMLHYSADLSTAKTAGAFGWDDTPSVVPASIVPSYTGSSSYLILCKYNNYSDSGISPYPGDGENKVAILDPNATENYTVQYQSGDGTGPTYVTMNEVLSVLGLTPNVGIPGVREWCINSAAVDAAGKGAVVNCEDGNCYRWDFTTNTLTQVVNLQPATSEAYTSTAVSADGISFAINNAELFAMWDGVKPSAVSASAVIGGNGETGTVTLASNATGPGATIALSSDNPNMQVPASVTVAAGSNTANFNITSTATDGAQTAHITANRYGFTTTSLVSASGSGLSAVSLNSSSVYGGVATSGSVALVGTAPTSGRTVTLSSSLSSVKFGATSGSTPTSTLVLNYVSTASQPFYYFTTPVAATQTGTITATLDDATTTTTSVTNKAALLTTFSAATSITGGSSETGSITYTGGLPTGGMPTTMTYSAHTNGPATVTSTAATTTFTINSVAVASTVTENITASNNGTAKTLHVTITKQPTLVGFGLSNSSPYMTFYITGTVILNSPAVGGQAVTAKSLDANSTIISQPVVASGATSATFVIAANQLSTNTSQLAHISATYGTVTLTVSMTVQPYFMKSFSCSPTVIHAGHSATLTITVSPYVGQTGLKVKLQSSSTVLTVPATATMSTYGQTTITVPITAATTVTGTNRVSITANCAGDNSLVLVTVEP